jgi:putative addiction module antidote
LVRYPIMTTLKVTTTGNSLAVRIPQSVVERLRLKKGDEIFLVETEDGFRVTPYSPDFAEQMRVAEGVIARYRNALRELAKS